MKYIVESVGLFRMVHVVECDNEADAMLIAENADELARTPRCVEI